MDASVLLEQQLGQGQGQEQDPCPRRRGAMMMMAMMKQHEARSSAASSDGCHSSFLLARWGYLPACKCDELAPRALTLPMYHYEHLRC